MSKWIRVILLLLSLILMGVCIMCECPEYLDYISIISTFVLSAICAWENNDFTFAARVGTKVTEAIKDGKLIPKEILEILEKTNDT